MSKKKIKGIALNIEPSVGDNIRRVSESLQTLKSRMTADQLKMSQIWSPPGAESLRRLMEESKKKHQQMEAARKAIQGTPFEDFMKQQGEAIAASMGVSQKQLAWELGNITADLSQEKFIEDQVRRVAENLVPPKGAQKFGPNSDWFGPDEEQMSEMDFVKAAGEWLKESNEQDMAKTAMVMEIMEHPELYYKKCNRKLNTFFVMAKSRRTPVDNMGFKLKSRLPRTEEEKVRDLMMDYRSGKNLMRMAPGVIKTRDSMMKEAKFKAGDVVYVMMPDLTEIDVAPDEYSMGSVLDWANKITVEQFVVGAVVPNHFQMSHTGEKVPAYICMKEGDDEHQYKIRESSMSKSRQELIEEGVKILQSKRDAFNEAIEKLYGQE